LSHSPHHVNKPLDLCKRKTTGEYDKKKLQQDGVDRKPIASTRLPIGASCGPEMRPFSTLDYTSRTTALSIYSTYGIGYIKCEPKGTCPGAGHGLASGARGYGNPL
jgi:hypothetical protein